jgi:RNA recognition motif-containing protein
MSYLPETPTTLFVANFGDEIEEKDLERLFGRCGEVVGCKIWVDLVTGNPKGFGFVTMGSREMANDAITALNGKYWHRHRLKVQLGRE